jgi:DNA replication and repair protein RecF
VRILSAKVDGFRNLVPAEFTFSPRVNLVLGRNGEGKTNLLEALNYLALGRSHRGSSADEMIHFDAETLHVSLEVEEDSGAVVTCEFGLARDGGRRFRIDGEAVRRRADLVGRLATVFFNPDSIRLVQGSPQRRRHFADRGMAELDPLQLTGQGACQKALKQKAGLLRDLRKGYVDRAATLRELTAWNRELAEHAAMVCEGRRLYASALTPPATESHNSLTDNDLKLDFSYRPNLECVRKKLEEDRENPFPLEDLKADIFSEFDYIMESEIRRGRPLIGPQQDDFSVLLNGLDLRTFGSQGETRTAAISLILARSEVLYRKRQIRPVLFFDDIFSELDRERTRRLQDMASDLHQVFVATARPDDVAGWQAPEMERWRVEAGSFTAVTGI